jgi:hypothetical protein
MLPCNVILRTVEGGLEMSAIDHVVSMQAIANNDLQSIAAEVCPPPIKAVEAA